MAELVEKIFGINLLVMRILGFYPPQKYRQLYKLYSFAVYCFFTTLIPVLSSLYLITDQKIDLDTISQSAFVICQLGCFIVKMIPFLTNEDEIKKSIHMIEHPIFRMYTKEQGKIIENCAKITKQTSWFFISACFACLVTWSIAPFFEKDYKLPIDVWLPYDFKANLLRYVMSFIYVMAGAGSGAISNGAIDPMIAGLAYYATSQIKILKDNLTHLSEYAEMISREKTETKDQEKLKQKIIYDGVKHCVHRHNVILDFVHNFEKIYSLVVFTQFSASVLVICICCFQLSKMQLFTMSFVWMITFLMTMLSEIFLYCYFGTTLYEENNTLIYAVYMGNWYDYDIQTRKTLITLMENSKKPMIVTAGKILDLSLQTFTTILKSAYSLFAVLKNY